MVVRGGFGMVTAFFDTKKKGLVNSRRYFPNPFARRQTHISISIRRGRDAWGFIVMFLTKGND